MEFALITIFGTSFIIALSGALMPGPLLTVTVSESPQRGVMTGPLMILGHGILELILVVALLSGLAPLLMRDDAFIFISLTGASILLWMGMSMLKSVPSMRLDSQQDSTGSTNLVVAGIVLSAANPYWLIWWASIGIGYIVHSQKFGILGITAFFLGHILADLLWYTCVSFSISKGRHLISDRVYRFLISCCGIFLIVFSCWFSYSGVSKLFSILTQ